MNKVHIIFSSILFAIIIGLAFFINMSGGSKQNDKSTIIPSPTINLDQPFQLISPAQSQQTQQDQQQQQQDVQGAQIQSSQQQEVQPQQTAVSPTPQIDSYQGSLLATVSATIQTSKGTITMSLFADKAPKTVRNFISKAQSGFYNNLTFHRVEGWVVQGGDPNGNGTGGGQMPAEQTPGINFVVGSVGIARGSDPTINNASQFFITKQDASWLNGQYTNFGMVTSGMDVVNKIQIGDKIQSITVDLTQTEGGLQE